MLIHKHIILFFFFAFLSLFCQAQTEAEMKVEADKLFDTEQYLQATPLYLRLLSLQPKDLGYNYRYGVCLLYNSNRKQDAIKYLSNAVNNPNAVPETYYFLGKALHMNYQFNEAIKQYTIYIEKRVKGGKEFDAEREIQMCQNGKRLMTTISDIIVIEKKELTSDKFFRVYDLKDIGGNLLVTTDFQSKLDKKNNHIPLIHFPQNPAVIYYSSYGDNGTHGKDIYVRRKLPDGTWGLPQPIPGNVNTNFDEDFPYMHPDGNYLYFSSKGHNSMGGYDVFRSRYDPENNSYGPPENMDFAISSPDDDMFYIVDSLNKNAYFASARQSEIGKLFVYKVNVDRVPIQLAVIKGNFVSEVDPKIKKINFEIKDYANGEVIGKFNSNDKAVYLITFPKGGKYEYIMTIEGVNKEFRSIVSIPFMKEFKPLKQKIVHAMDDGQEVVRIINLFNEEVDDPAAVIAEVIKMRSQLDVNVKEFDLEEIEQERKNKEVLSELGLGDLLMVEVEDVLKQQLKKSNDNKKLIGDIENNINNLVVENSQDFVHLEEQIKNKVAEANKTQNTDSKYILLREAQDMIKKQDELKKYSKDLLKLNDSIKNVISQSTSGMDHAKLQSITEGFEKLYREDKEKEAIQLIAENKEFILKVLNDNSIDLVQNLVDKVVKYDEEITASKLKVDGYNREISDLEIEILSLQNSIYSAKKKDVPAIEQKIASKKEEITLIEEERNLIQAGIDKKTLEKYKINQQIEILQDAISNKSIVSVTKEQAKKALTDTEKTNTNTLNSYVNQQINELEKQDPTLKDRIVIASGLKGQNIYDEFQSSEKGINNDPSLNKEDKLYKLLNNERSAVKLLNKRIEEIEKSQANNSTDESLNKEKYAINNYIKEINLQIEAHEKQVEVLIAQNGAADPDKIISSIQPDYTENKKFIESNSNLSQKEKLESLNQTDAKLIVAVDKELNAIKTQIANDPTNKILQNKQQSLKEIKSTTQSAIDQRKKDLDSPDLTVTTVTKEELIRKLDPGIEIRKANIQSNTDLNTIEKLEELNKEDQKFLALVEREINIVNSQLSNDPTNKTLQNKLDVLTELKSSTEYAIDQRNKALASSDVAVNSVSKDEIVKQLDPSIENRKTNIESNPNLNSEEKLVALNKEDKNFLSAVEKELNLVNTQLTNNPANKTLQSKQEILTELVTSLEKTIEQRNKDIESSDVAVNSVTKDEIIKQLDPSIETRKTNIESNPNLNSKEKLEALNKEDENFLSTVEKELNTVNTQLSNDPTNKTLQNKLEVLTELKTSSEKAIEERNENFELSDVAVTTVSKDEIIKQLDPSIETRKTNIESNNSLNSIEKLEALNKEDEKLLNVIENELNVVEKQLTTDPTNDQLKTKQDVLAEIYSSIQSSMDQRLIQINSINSENESVSDSKKLISQLKPNYIKETEKIQNDQSLTAEEKMSQLQIKDKELVSEIDTKIVSIEKQLSKDPKNAELIVQKEQLNDLKSITEAKIDEREQLMDSKLSSEVSAEYIAEQKVILRNKIDPSYEKKKEAIQSGTDDILKKKNAELKLDQQFLDKLNSEEAATKKILTKDPFNEDARKKMQVLSSLKNETTNNIDQLKNDIESIKRGDLIADISELEKNNTINEIYPDYLSTKASIENSSELSDLEKVEKLILEEKQLLSSIELKQEELTQELQNNPTNQDILKNQKILNSIESESRDRLKILEEKINELKKDVSFSESVKNDKINEIRPEYELNVKEIENDSDLSQVEKLNQLQTEDQKLLGQIYDKLEQIEEQISSDPNNKSLQTEKKLLDALAADLEKTIEQRQAVINKGGIVESIRDEEKEDMIISLVPSYKEDIRIIRSLNLEESETLDKLIDTDRNLLAKVNEAIAKLELELVSDPENSTKLREKEILEAVRKDLMNSIVTLEEQLKNAGTSDISSTEIKEQIESINPNYLTEKNRIEQDSDLSTQEKAKQLLALQNNFLDEVRSEKMSVQQQIDRDPTNSKLLNELNILKKIELDLEIEIENNKRILNETSPLISSQLETEKVITDLFPDYESRKENLISSKMQENKKVEERIKLEKELLAKLISEEKSLNKALSKDPDNEELQQRLSIVKQLIQTQNENIAKLEEQKTQLESEQNALTIISKTDPSYQGDMERLGNSETSTKKSDLAEREVVHQERIESQISANEKALVKKENPSLVLANNILKKELEESKQREANYRQGTDIVSENSEKKAEYISALREDLLQGNGTILTDEKTTVSELKEQDKILADYQASLEQSIEEQNSKIESDPSDSELKAELAWLESELAEVKKKRYNVSVSIGELETEVITVKSNERFDDPKLNELAVQEVKLKQELTDASLTKKEQQTIQKELNQVQKEKTLQENNLLREAIDTEQDENKNLTAVLNASGTTNEKTRLNVQAATTQKDVLEKESDLLSAEANKTSNPEEKKFLLNEALVKQEKANDIAIEAIVMNTMEQLAIQNGISSLETTEDLEKRKRRYSVEIGDLTNEIIRLDEEIAKSKEKDAVPLIQERTQKEEQRALLQKQVDAIDAKLAIKEEKIPTLRTEAMNQEVSYNEERQIAMTDEYKDYEAKAKAALAVEKQIATLEAQLSKEKSLTKQLVANSINEPSDENKAALKEHIEEIKQIETDLLTLRSELQSKQQVANEVLPTNTEEAMKIQNLVIRGIQPIQRLAVAAALVQLPANGLAISPDGTNTYSAANPIPVDVKNPTGLVYRVQVGAFAKPIPQDLFKEFNPVSGEKLTNGITRYLAGYFNSSAKVVDARDQIKNLGYTDAFAVAYCDGVRITLAEARILEANGQCVPKGENDLLLEIAENTAITMGLEDTVRKRKVEDFTYHQAPGAVKAEPIEKHLGLFFTVQVGVYNRPVRAEVVYNMNPMMTVRLPNGQIRYSVGIFNSIDDSRPKKQEAIQKGVKDAFITAYYNGERITLAEAQRLLDEKGNSILENNQIKKEEPVVVEPSQPEIGTTPVDPVVEVIERKKQRIQIVTKKSFDEFPREILNRYNSHGSFYYDENDKLVKSAVVGSVEELPSVYYFKDDVDTLYLLEEMDEPANIISLTFAQSSLPGDFIDWLLRYNYQREFIQREESIELRIYRIPDDKLPELEEKLKQFGLTWNNVSNETE